MRVLIAMDSSSASQHLLDEAVARPWPADTIFSIVNVVDIQRFTRFTVLVEEAKREAEELLKAATEKLVRSGRKA